MKALYLSLSGFFALSLIASAGSTYRVTGPVVEVTDSKIVVEKENEKWEIARTPETKVTGDLKVGSKVTIQYTMTASSVEVKPDKAAKPEKPEKPETKPEKKK